MSAKDYDSQLLESVAVRRRRLRDAVLFGRSVSGATLDENATGRWSRASSWGGAVCRVRGVVVRFAPDHREEHVRHSVPVSTTSQPPATPTGTSWLDE